MNRKTHNPLVYTSSLGGFLDRPIPSPSAVRGEKNGTESRQPPKMNTLHVRAAACSSDNNVTPDKIWGVEPVR